jgi:hypothetical protein
MLVIYLINDKSRTYETYVEIFKFVNQVSS